MMREAELVVLCLHDEAARESAALCAELEAPPKLLDASTAHRVNNSWTYGFPELSVTQRERIAKAPRVANPGCYATGAIALLRPLVDAELLSPDAALTIPAVSGYSGGGRAMIEAYEAGEAPPCEGYGLGLRHKHIPEIMCYGRLRQQPIFLPLVANFPQGMIVQLPLPRAALTRDVKLVELREILHAHYGQLPESSVIVREDAPPRGRLDAAALAGEDGMEIWVTGDESAGQALLVARFDNLGKGAAGAALANLKLMLGLTR